MLCYMKFLRCSIIIQIYDKFYNLLYLIYLTRRFFIFCMKVNYKLFILWHFFTLVFVYVFVLVIYHLIYESVYA